MDFELTLEQFITQKERFTVVTFEPTGEPTPQPLKADLAWVWAVLLLLCLLLVWFLW